MADAGIAPMPVRRPGPGAGQSKAASFGAASRREADGQAAGTPPVSLQRVLDGLRNLG